MRTAMAPSASAAATAGSIVAAGEVIGVEPTRPVAPDRHARPSRRTSGDNEPMHDHAHDAGHAHALGHSHTLDLSRAGNVRRMSIALGANVVMVVLGVAGAVITGSLALLADAGHVLSDVLSIVLGLAAARLAMRPATTRGTFGMGRVEIFAALINGLALVAVSVYIAFEAIGRFSDPVDVEGLGVIVFGALGLTGNVIATVVLAGGDRDDINLEGVLRILAIQRNSSY